jgi:mRNA interferase RelE/StbE
MFDLELSSQAEKSIARLHKRDRQLISRFYSAFDEIKANPFGAKSLSGELRGLRSYRVGNYRIIFEIDLAGSVINIITIKHRRDVYR